LPGQRGSGGQLLVLRRGTAVYRSAMCVCHLALSLTSAASRIKSPFVVGRDIAFLVAKCAIMDKDEKTRNSLVKICMSGAAWPSLSAGCLPASMRSRRDSIAMNTPRCSNRCLRAAGKVKYHQREGAPLLSGWSCSRIVLRLNSRELHTLSLLSHTCEPLLWSAIREERRI
jgi:hypothetical protein